MIRLRSELTPWVILGMILMASIIGPWLMLLGLFSLFN